MGKRRQVDGWEIRTRKLYIGKNLPPDVAAATVQKQKRGKAMVLFDFRPGDGKCYTFLFGRIKGRRRVAATAVRRRTC